MKNDTFCYLAAAALGIGWLLTPVDLRAARNYNLSVDVDRAEHCADLKLRSSNGEVAQIVDAVTLGARDASMLEIEDNAGRAVVHVRGWDRAEYSVETCKVAVSDTQQAAETLARGITVSHSAGRFTSSGPAGDNGHWQVIFLVRAPKNGSLDLQTKNGPIDVSGVAGTIKVRAVNGPIALKDCAGQIDAHTTNGPISFSGNGGDVRLTAQNGPISIDLTGENWNGPQLDAKTQNGPLSLNIGENFRSGVRLQTSGHAPMSCHLAACASALVDSSDSSKKTIQLNGSTDTVRVTTNNGPVSINGPSRRRI